MPAATTSELEHPREDITPRKFVLDDDGGDVFTRSSFRWPLLGPDRASTVFSQQQSMVDRMNSGTTPHKKQRPSLQSKWWILIYRRLAGNITRSY
jgi:hypothetical protein